MYILGLGIIGIGFDFLVCFGYPSCNQVLLVVNQVVLNIFLSQSIEVK